MSQPTSDAERRRGDAAIYRVESLAVGGEGVSRRDGKVCFIPGALPQEDVEAAPGSKKRRYDRLRLLRVVRPSPDRRLPLCPHSGVCGGCAIQSLRYESQLAAKAEQVRECLQRIGGLRLHEAGPPLPSPALVSYRNKMEFTFTPRPWLPAGPPPADTPTPGLGLHVPGRFDAVFDLEFCALPSQPALAALRRVREFSRGKNLTAWRGDTDEGLLRHLVVREGKNTGEVLVALVVRRDHPSLPALADDLAATVPNLVGFVVIENRLPATVARGEIERTLYGRPFLLERLCGLTFAVQAQSFFQTNTCGAEVLIQTIRRFLTDRPGGHLLDLYCGAGTLGLALADRFDRVTGVEQVSGAVADARANAERNRISHAEFVHADVERWIKESFPAGRPSPYSGVIVDPPRAGLHPRALGGLLHLQVPWILFVSCNPATLARDAALLHSGGYEPLAMQVVDMFPHTAHVETVVLFQRRSG